MKRKGLVVGISLLVLLALTSVNVEARGCLNPLFLPFAIAGAVVGTAAAIATAAVPVHVHPAYVGPVYSEPAYYPPPRVHEPPPYRPGAWMRGHHDHYDHYGYRPGHWR